MTVEEARKILTDAGLFFGVMEPDDDPKWNQTLNLNDAFFWACSDCEYVEDSELPRLASLFWKYGWCGVAYWVCYEKREGMLPEFLDQRRFVEFVRQEEELIKQQPKSSKRAYTQLEYTLGKPQEAATQ